MTAEQLEILRSRVTDIDNQIMKLIAQRLETVAEIGKVKRHEHFPLRDFEREQKVLENARQNALALGISPNLAKFVIKKLMEYSLGLQEQQDIIYAQKGTGKKALIIGGLGKIGNWFLYFLNSQGFTVSIADSQIQKDTASAKADWRSFDLDFDVIVVATPLGISNSILEALAQFKPKGLIFDVASLKGPICAGINALQKAGCQVTSIHPMFGPDAEMLTDRHVLFLDTGCKNALQNAKALFSHTGANCIEIPLEQHDKIMGFVLGLSHLFNITFFYAITKSIQDLPELLTISSTSFDAQISVAHRISTENPNLYFEIQRLNEFRHLPQKVLLESLAELIEIIETQDKNKFVDIMKKGHACLCKMDSVLKKSIHPSDTHSSNC